MNAYFVLDCSLDRVALNAVKEVRMQTASRNRTGLARLGNLLALKASPKRSGVSACSLGVCCVKRNAISTCHETQVLRKANGRFNLREFHQALAGTTEILMLSSSYSGKDKGTFSISRQISSLGVLLQSDDAHSLWDPHASAKKIIFIGCEFLESISTYRDTLLEAAKQNIFVQFVCLNRIPNASIASSDLTAALDKSSIVPELSAFPNCSYQSLPCDPWLLDQLVKGWFQEVTRYGAQLEAVLEFPLPLFIDANSIKCQVHPRKLQLTNTIIGCETCRCHGAPLDEQADKLSDGALPLTCPVTGQDLDIWDCQTNGLKIGDETILYLPSFKNPPRTSDLSIRPQPAVIKVLSKVSLTSLSEDLLFGLPHVLTPLSEHQENSSPKEDSTTQVFAAVCQTLRSADCGLLCSSGADWEEGNENPITCFYLLLPADGSLLMKKIVAAEELLPISRGCKEVVVSRNVKEAVESALSKMEFDDYNPLHYDTGCHSRVSWLVKESLQVRMKSTTEAVRRYGRNLHKSINVSELPEFSPASAVPGGYPFTPPPTANPHLPHENEPTPYGPDDLASTHAQKMGRDLPYSEAKQSEVPSFPPRYPLSRHRVLPSVPSQHTQTLNNSNGFSPGAAAHYAPRQQHMAQDVRAQQRPRNSGEGAAYFNREGGTPSRPAPLPVEFRSASAVLDGRSQDKFPDKSLSSSGLRPLPASSQKSSSRKRSIALHSSRPGAADAGKAPKHHATMQGNLTIAQRRALLESNAKG